MTSRQNWFWVILDLVLAALVFINHHYLHKKMPGPEKVLPGLAADRVTSLQIRPLGQSEIRVERDNGSWVLTEPLSYPAQTLNIENLLAALEKLTAAAHITTAELRNRPDAEEEYGLSNPQA